MQRLPLTLDQAKQITQQCAPLIGRLFNSQDPTSNITDIVISPFDQANKKRFLLYYLLNNDAEKALHQEYRGLLFDVLVLGSTSEDDLVYENIESWLRQNDLTLADIANLSKTSR
jgi:hypothetical protein